MNVFGTGHRELFGFDNKRIYETALKALELRDDISTVYCGMAQGWDLMLGKAALDVGHGVIAVRPWLKHRPTYEDFYIYNDIVDAAEEVVVIHPYQDYPGPWVYHARNHYMVDHSDYGLGLWDGRHSGGTWECMVYAASKGKQVHNCIGLGSE